MQTNSFSRTYFVLLALLPLVRMHDESFGRIKESVAERNVQKELKQPKSWDWRSEGCVSEVKNQGFLGVSTVFAATEAAETMCCKDSGSHAITVLSEDQMGDCCTQHDRFLVPDVYGCLRKKEGGMCAASSYPPHTKGVCTPCRTVCQVQSTYEIPSKNRDLFEKAVWNTSAVALIQVNENFQLYTGGIYDDVGCNNITANHAIQVVGYGTDEATNVDYWILRNSWGSSWGEKGYMRMVRGKNMCGILNQAFAPN